MSTQTNFTFPLPCGQIGILHVPFPMSSDSFDNMMIIIESMRLGMVSDTNPSETEAKP